MTAVLVALTLATQPRPAPIPQVEVETRQAVPRRWVQVADCESDRRWRIDSLHDGGLQHHPDTWRSFKPDGFPPFAWQATAVQQVTVAERVLAAQGPSAWPNCGGPLS